MPLLDFWLTFGGLYATLTAMKTDQAILEAALIGYQHQLSQIQEKMADLRRQLGGKASAGVSVGGGAAVPGRKREMSAAARKRIAAAQKKRWAEYHKLKASQA